jgi:hypothetical protein
MTLSRNIGLAVMAVALMATASCGHQQTGGRTGVSPPDALKGRCVPTRLVELEHNRLMTFRVDILPGGHGSGALISTEGHILTAEHVVKDAKGLQIRLLDKNGKTKVYPAKVIAVDAEHDLAVIKIDRKFRSAAVIGGLDEIRAGDAVYNVGYPHDFGELIGRGNIMRTDWSETFRGGSKVDRAMLADIKDGAGTSGSGVFSAYTGHLIGVLVSKVWVRRRTTPATVVHVVVPVRFIRPLLQKAKVKFRTGFSPLMAPASSPKDKK